MNKTKVGIIGCGGIANGKHLPALKKLAAKGLIEIVAFCDLIEERAVKAAKEYGTEDAKVYTDYKELLKDNTIEAIHVCTPNRSHSFITVDALHAGKNVICEKPMAINSAEARKMVEAAQETGKLLTIGYQNRQTPEVQYIKKTCDAGDLGDIYYAKAHAIRRRAVPTWGVFLNEYEQGGGPLIDIGTHALDITLWTMNNYKPKMVVGSVYHKLADKLENGSGNAWGDWDPKEFTVEDSAFGYIVMENGATIVLESAWALNSLDVIEASTTLCGDKAGADMRSADGKRGGVRINGVKHGKQYVEIPAMGAGGVDFYDGTAIKPADVEQEIFYSAIRNGTPLCVLPEQAFVVTQILEAIYESAKTGKPVYFD
jgi:predicted dehydrogenase